MGARAALTLVGARAALTLVGALESWTEPAEMKMSWAGPAEELESTCEEPAPEGAGEEQALEGAGEEQALGLDSKPSPHNPLTSPGVPGGARVALTIVGALESWTEPAEMKMSWAGPVEELESTCEESALEGAGEEQAPEGSGEEQAPEGAG